jgi:hypothetical protein
MPGPALIIETKAKHIFQNEDTSYALPRPELMSTNILE